MLTLFNKRLFGTITPSSKRGHLAGAHAVNKLSVSQPKLLTSNFDQSKWKTPNISINHTGQQIGSKYLVNLELNSSSPIIRPSIFVCALDVSSSMGDSCTHQSNQEESKFSRLDLVQHSINTIIRCLRPVDKLALITFSDNAMQLLSLKNMDVDGKRDAIRAVKSMRANGYTNLWDGMSSSLDILEKINDENTNKFLLTLTDGEPNVLPPRGIYREFLHKIGLEQNSYPLDFGVHNFGYAYGLDSVLLTDISTAGGGLFAHIPDHTMCNTVFINFLANCLATSVNKVTIRQKSKSNCSVSILGHKLLENGCVDIGAIQTDQQRNVLLSIDNITDLSKLSVELELCCEGKILQYVINGTNIVKMNDTKSITNLNKSNQSNPIMSNSMMSYEIVKNMLIQTIDTIMKSGKLDDSFDELKKICDLIDTLKSTITDKKTLAHLTDLSINIKSANSHEGQIEKALTNKDWYQRWGQHYLRYFIRSHRLETCTNFKDPSLQNYGGKTFKELKAEIEDIFSTIPAPQPSLSSQQFSGNFTQSFYSPSGPCFDGDGVVALSDGTTKLVKELVKGDKIKNSDGNVSTIVCVLKTLVKTGKTQMATFNNVKITPWHPVRINGKWQYPAKIQLCTETKCEWLYDLVLDNHHVVTINGLDTIGLGHNFIHDPILIHPFFGTDQVIDEMKKDKDGWNKGLVIIKDYKPVYSKTDSNDVVGFII